MHGAKRNKNLLALLFIDLDGFQNINDTYGRDADDEVLSAIADRMNKRIKWTYNLIFAIFYLL